MLVVNFSIIKGYINLWHAPSHIIYCVILFDVVDPIIDLFPMQIVPQQNILSITPTFQGLSLRVTSLTWNFSEWFLSTLGWKNLLIHTSGRKAHPRDLHIVLKS
jgi:hypothetical protein